MTGTMTRTMTMTCMLRPLSAALLFLVAALASAPAVARADTVGVFVPGAPFGGPLERVELANRLAAHLTTATGKAWTGRAFARAVDFVTAVRRGELQLAVVDAPFAATARYRFVAQATRGGASASAWQLVAAPGITRLDDLRGKTVAVAKIGTREEDLVYRVLLEGELAPGAFELLSLADSLSAVAAVERGRAQAAFVPGGISLPAGVTRLLTLTSIPEPVLVALPEADQATLGQVGEAMTRFSGPVFARWTRDGEDALRALARAFARGPRRAPLAVKPLRIEVDALLAGRSFALPRSSVADLVERVGSASAAPQRSGKGDAGAR